MFKKGKNRLNGVFDYKEDQLKFKNISLRNSFLDGKLSGEVKFLPYFNFDLSLDLNGLNFNRFYALITNLSEKSKKELFKIDRKINGKLNLDVNKIYSKYDLIKSFESEIKFSNGNIFIDKMLFNLNKLGAADISGIVKNDGKFSNFVFENNIFFDNQKYFYTKFGIYNKKEISSNFFISGSFDLENLVMRFNEISDEKK